MRFSVRRSSERNTCLGSSSPLERLLANVGGERLLVRQPSLQSCLVVKDPPRRHRPRALAPRDAAGSPAARPVLRDFRSCGTRNRIALACTDQLGSGVAMRGPHYRRGRHSPIPITAPSNGETTTEVNEVGTAGAGELVFSLLSATTRHASALTTNLSAHTERITLWLVLALAFVPCPAPCAYAFASCWCSALVLHI